LPNKNNFSPEDILKAETILKKTLTQNLKTKLVNLNTEKQIESLKRNIHDLKKALALIQIKAKQSSIFFKEFNVPLLSETIKILIKFCKKIVEILEQKKKISIIFIKKEIEKIILNKKRFQKIKQTIIKKEQQKALPIIDTAIKYFENLENSFAQLIEKPIKNIFAPVLDEFLIFLKNDLLSRFFNHIINPIIKDKKNALEINKKGIPKFLFSDAIIKLGNLLSIAKNLEKKASPELIALYSAIQYVTNSFNYNIFYYIRHTWSFITNPKKEILNPSNTSVLDQSKKQYEKNKEKIESLTREKVEKAIEEIKIRQKNIIKYIRQEQNKIDL